MQGTAATEGDSGDGGDAPAESKGEFPWAAIGVPTVLFVPSVPRMVSDGCPRQRTSKTFPISQTEFKKSFLQRQAQSIVILSTGSHVYGMTVNAN